MEHGNSFANGPQDALAEKTRRNSGWDLRSVTHWDFTEGRLSF
jgi:hypothetical protein